MADKRDKTIIIKKFAESYLSSLTNLDVVNKPFFIFFSALHGSGKTTLGKTLAEDLGAVLIGVDEIKMMMSEQGYTRDEYYPLIRPIFHQVWNEIIDNKSNKLVIFDLGIDQWFDDKEGFFQRAKSRKIPYYLIRISLTVEEAKKRVALRGREDSHITLNQLDDVNEAFQKCKAKLSADFNYNGDPDYNNLLNDIRLKMKDNI